MARRRNGCWRAALAVAALIGLTACNPNRFVSGWVPYWNAPDGRAGFMDPTATSMFADVSPFFFTARPDGTIGLVGSVAQLTKTIDEASSRHIKVLPSITDGSGKSVMATVILGDPANRAQHIANILSLLDTYPKLDGFDLDYEGFAFSDGAASWPTTQPLWVSFVTELAAALHSRGKLLSVTIPPTWMDVEVGALHGYPVYAPLDIGAVADRVRLMVYDWSVSSPGPISPMSWLKLVIAYNDAIPNSKLQLGVPSYGRNWGRKANATEICPDGALSTSSIELENMQAVIDAHGAVPARDTASGEMKFTYNVVATGYSTTALPAPPYIPPTHVAPILANAATGDDGGLQPALRLTPPTTQLSCTVRHTVYYPDAAAIQQHAQAALSAGWSGVVIWALGYETADVYSALANTNP
ncbi:MAG TPA: glycosyl hydrolase family 18 protein [Ilumatobacteraceae bacterium]